MKRLLLILGLPAIAAAAPPSYQLVARSGGAAPGVAGATFASFGAASLSPRGDVAFTARVTEGAAVRNAVFVRRPSGTVIRLATEGNAAPLYPGEGTRPFSSFRAPVVDAAGRVTFFGILAWASGSVESWEDQGLWIWPDGGTGSVPLWMIVRENHRASLAADGTLIAWDQNPPMFDRFLGLVVSPPGVLSFRADIKSYPTAIHNGKTGLWSYPAPASAPHYGNVPRAVAVTATAAPGAGGVNFVSPGSAAISSGASLAFSSSTSDANPLLASGLWTGTAGNLTLLAAAGGAAPDVPGGAFYEFGTPAMNSAGEVMVRAGTVAGGAEGDGVWTNHSGSLRSLARSGQGVPQMAGYTFVSFGEPVSNLRGQTAFTATARSASGSRIEMICLGGQASLLRVVARSGDATPDASGYQFHSFCQPRLNAAGQLAFAALAGPAADAGSHSGVWGMDSGGVVRLVAMKGQPLTIAPGDTRTVEAVSAAAFSDAGEIALQLSFTGSTAAMVVASLAPPAAQGYSAWAAAAIPPGKPAGTHADADGDGVPNLLEYAFSTDPASSSSVPDQAIGLFDNGSLAGLTYVRRSGLGDYRCIVESSSDLINWTARPSAESDSILMPDSTEIISALVPNGNAPHFYLRVRVQP